MEGSKILQIDWKTIEGILIGIAIPLLALFGKAIKGYWEKRSKDRAADIEEKRVSIEDEKAYYEGLRSTTDAAKQMSNILTEVIQPLSNRVKQLEEDAQGYLKEIRGLRDEIYNLEHVIRIKDDEIVKFKNEYNKQVEIIRDQEVKISAQEVRIAELECELIKIKKGQKQC